MTVPEVVPLKRENGGPIYLWATQEFHFADDPRYPGDRKVVTDAYAYTLSESEDIATELLAWHWQPEGGHWPHLHIGHGDARYSELSPLHIPSGRVAFEEVLMFLVEELGVACSEPAQRVSLRRSTHSASIELEPDERLSGVGQRRQHLVVEPGAHDVPDLLVGQGDLVRRVGVVLHHLNH